MAACLWADARSQLATGNCLYSEAVLQGADAVAGYGELGVLRVLQREDDFAGEPGIDFVNPVDID